MEYIRLTTEHAPKLGRFFQDLKADGCEKYFHPHPLNIRLAFTVCIRRTKDLFFIAQEKERIAAYGMLRGWEEGYDIPSLGIAVHPDFRGQGVATGFIRFLHSEAAKNKAQTVRLTVHESNTAAAALYEKIGYKFTGLYGDKLIGFCGVGSEGSE